MALEIVDLPIKNGGSFHSFLYVYQRVDMFHRKIPQASTAFSTPRQRQCQAQERLRRTAQSLFRRAARAARADVHGGVAWVGG